MLQANHVTATSPGVVMDPGNANIALQGVFYQPRGVDEFRGWQFGVHVRQTAVLNGTNAPSR